MRELTFLKELILIKQLHQESVIFITTGIFTTGNFQPYLWNRFHDLLMISMNCSSITISKIKNADYRYFC